MSKCADAFCGQSKNHLGNHDDFPLPVPEVPATNDPKPPVCENCGRAMAEDGYYGSPIWWCSKCRRSIPRRAEVPADEGTLHREQWEEMLSQHRPVTSFKDGSIAGCTCLDRVFYKGREDWDTHLTDVILPILATELQKARSEVAGIDPYDHALSCASTRWDEDGPVGDSGVKCDCYLSRAGVANAR